MATISDQILDYPKAVSSQFFNDEANAKQALENFVLGTFKPQGLLVQTLISFKS